MKVRATRDLEVIKQWKIAVAAHAAQAKPKFRIAAKIALAGAICLALTHWLPWMAVPAFLSLIIAALIVVVEQTMERAVLKCPHCGEPPIRGRGRTAGAEFCEHCLYWLNPPFGAGSDEGSGAS